jgi:predicted nucleotidyltransferase
MTEPLSLASKTAADLANVPGVVAVVLGGSYARGDADHRSDIDIGIYYRHETTVDTRALDTLAVRLDDRREAGRVTAIGEWGPWINGGAWLVVEGRRVDWLYRDLADVELAITSARAGLIQTYYQPGHPHGFHNYIYAGEVHYGRALHDPERVFSRLRATTLRYPAKLKSAIVSKFMWEAQFALETAKKSAARRDVAYVTGCLFRSAMCMVQVLFALNERYFVNEKGSVASVETFPTKPTRFAHIVRSVLAEPGHTTDELNTSLDKIRALADRVAKLASG